MNMNKRSGIDKNMERWWNRDTVFA